MKEFYLTEFPFKQQIKKNPLLRTYHEPKRFQVMCFVLRAVLHAWWKKVSSETTFRTWVLQQVNFLVGLTLACLPYKAPYSFPHWVNHKIIYSHSDKWKDDICWEHVWMQPVLRIYVFNFIYFCRCPSFYLVIAKWSF